MNDAPQATVEIELMISDTEAVPVTGHGAAHVHSTMSESLFSPALYTHTIETSTTSYVDKLLRRASSSGTPTVRCRVGVGSPDNRTWLPWQEHVMEGAAAAVKGLGDQAGHCSTFTTRDHFFRVGRESRVSSHKGAISAIVSAIAERNKLKSVIEPTTLNGLYIQNFIDDIQFVRSRLQGRALNSKGRGNYLFFMRDNVLHFHSPDYQTVVREIRFNTEASRELIEQDRSQKIIDKGAAGVNLVSYDVYTGETKEIRSNPDRSLRLGNEIPNLKSVPGAALFVPFHVSTNGQDEADAIANNIYESSRTSTFELAYTKTMDVSIGLGDIINIVIMPSEKSVSPYSGLYLVSQVVRDVERGALLSRVTLQRGEWAVNRADWKTLRDQGVNVEESNLAARGQAMNIGEAQSSRLTKDQSGFTGKTVILTAGQPG